MPTQTTRTPDMSVRVSSEVPNEVRKLSNFLCFAIYSANLAFGRAYKPILDKLGLTYTQYVAMVALTEQDDQTVGALGEKLFLESNTLTPILKKLESNRLHPAPARSRRRKAGSSKPDARRARPSRH